MRDLGILELFNDPYCCCFDKLAYCSFAIFKRPYSSVTKEVNKLSAEYKKKYVLTDEQREALVGIILGDGYLERVKASHNTRLTVEHASEQAAFVLFISELFEGLIKTDPVISSRKADRRTGKVYRSIRVKTLSFPCLSFFHELFYVNKTKIIPANIKDILTPRGLAFLIMGDGFIYNGVIIICTESFTKSEQELLIEALDTKFGILATLNKRVTSGDNSSYRIRISKRYTEKFVELIKPYFIPQMLYKLNYNKNSNSNNEID